eukprot:1109948-Pyramimonas_sp.AAC.1
MPWNEVPIEGKHGRVTMRKGKRRLKPVRVSLSNRLITFRQLFTQHGAIFLEKMASFMEAMGSNPSKAAKLLGVTGHQKWTDAVASCASGSGSNLVSRAGKAQVLHNALVEIVY